jgi:peptidoglycan-N-acetylglucosamine deacetylase
VDRRSFLRVLGSAGAGVAAAGAGVRLPSLNNVDGSGLGQTTTSAEKTDAATPVGPRPALGLQRVIWSVPTSTNYVALTFDDGPDPEFTPAILKLLDRYDVKATFNVMGWNALKHPELLKQAVSAGHEIGNHTWSHRDLAYESVGSTFRQLRAGKDAIENVVETPIRFLRPPRGELTGAAARAAAELRYDILLWSVTRGPTSVITPKQVTDWVIEHVTPGDVLGLHDGIGRGTFDPHTKGSRALRDRRRVEMTALPSLLAGVRAKGLEFTTASTLLKAAEASPPGV